ncbi:hypothetical protein BOX15_Mlig000362g1 [Macrostomum lignano]|uniref:GRIP domain-containing protein n=2 Tax=Macrostomum lignano TaxID=282301 RepID=A0A267F8V7_9PLAT|nr:hypothetical protein BOX15_Mlig000362g1 [Macrostomum lignano]
MFKKLRQKIEETDGIKKASDSLLGKYTSPGSGQQAEATSLGSESPAFSTASSTPHQLSAAAPAKSRSRQSSIGSAVSETPSSVAAAAAVTAGTGEASATAAAASALESLSRPELLQRLSHAQSLARRYKARLFEADNRLRDVCGGGGGHLLPKLAARDRLIDSLKLQSKLLSEGRPVPDDLLAEIVRAESEVAELTEETPAADLKQKASNGDSSLAKSDHRDREESAEKLRMEIQQLRELLDSKAAELNDLQKQLASLRRTAASPAAGSSSGSDPDASALEGRLRDAEAKLAAAEQRHRDERAIAAEEAAAGKRRLKQQLAELQQQLQAREREAALKDSTGATRESEIRTLKERLDSRLASEKRLREEVKARSAEATTLAEQLRASRQEAESLACECRDQRRQLEAGLSSQIEQLETEQADKLKAAAKEFQDRLDAKEHEFQAKFQDAVDRFQEAESRARAAHRLETDELLQGLEARELAEGRLRRQLEAAEAERDAALAELSASQSTSVEEVERLRAEFAEAEAGRLAAESTVGELRSQLEAAAAAASTGTAASGAKTGEGEVLADSGKDAIKSALSTENNGSHWLHGLAGQVDELRTAAVDGRHTGDSVSAEDYEAVKMYAADLQKQLMSVSSELSELRTRGPQPPPPQPPAPVASSRPDRHKTRAFTDIPEVEYLRNVLYKYMLGEKTQTLARVICTVLKFTDYQIQQIMDHEGKRAANWLVTP